LHNINEMTLFLTSNDALAIAGISVLTAALAYTSRIRFPKSALFFGGLAFEGLGLWLVVSTLELAQSGKAHTFSRRADTFSAAAAPTAAIWSYWIHLGLGAFLLLAGLYLLAAPFTKRGQRIRFERNQNAGSWSAKGVLQLLFISILMFIAIALWKR
jgi:hypothetical protein